MVKMNTGRWRWSESTTYPLWDAIKKCPLWSAEEWKAVWTALSKRVPTVDVELTDDKVGVLWNKGTEATNEDEDDTGTKILIGPIVQGRGMPIIAPLLRRPLGAITVSLIRESKSHIAIVPLLCRPSGPSAQLVFQ